MHFARLPSSRYTLDAEERRARDVSGNRRRDGGNAGRAGGPRGPVLSSAASEHAPIRSEHIGWAEQQPEDWWRAAREAIAAAIAAGEFDGAQIHAIGLTGQMHGCVMLDAAGEVLRPALIWCDQRTQPECDWLKRTSAAAG